MKVKLIIAIIGAAILVACTKTNPNLVTITGKITNPRGESASLHAAQGGERAGDEGHGIEDPTAIH